MTDDEAWRKIVENYGDTPEFPDLPATPPPEEYDEPGDPEPSYFHVLDDEGFVPAPPPPIPRPTPVRLAAWAGVLGGPMVFTIALVIGWRMPLMVSFLLIVWFIAGFALLVWQLPTGPADPDDDGARV